jgi:hypothetical protein
MPFNLKKLWQSLELAPQFPAVYTIVRPRDRHGRPHFAFTARSDKQACRIARKVMSGNGSAELWCGKKLVEII